MNNNSEIYEQTIPKYILHPGVVRSKNDGDLHYISAKQLIVLYRVKECECVVQPNIRTKEYRSWVAPEGAIHLYPRYDGNYSLEKYK